MPPPCLTTAAAFAKGGDRRSIAEVSVCCLHPYNSPIPLFQPPLNVTNSCDDIHKHLQVVKKKRACEIASFIFAYAWMLSAGV